MSVAIVFVSICWLLPVTNCRSPYLVMIVKTFEHAFLILVHQSSELTMLVHYSVPN